MDEVITKSDWNGLERRRFQRQTTISNARLRRVKPPYPDLQNVYTRDLSPFGACFTVSDAMVYKVNDEIRCTFVIRIPPNLIKIHFRLCRVAWARNGRLGLEFLLDDKGTPIR